LPEVAKVAKAEGEHVGRAQLEVRRSRGGTMRRRRYDIRGYTIGENRRLMMMMMMVMMREVRRGG
jgi:hypothetical protein